MRESVTDVLFYLFDDLLEGSQEVHTDIEQMVGQLNAVGFKPEHISKAVNWFCELSTLNDFQPDEFGNNDTIRIFAESEQALLGDDGIDYLQGLLRSGKVAREVVEKVIERALALEETLAMPTLQWITAMVLLNVYGYVADGVIPDQGLSQSKLLH